MTGLTGNVFITGGAGFLGRGIMRRARIDGWDTSFTIYSRDEQKHYVARDKYPARYIIGDILDIGRLSLAMVGHDIVIHTAALKYIPEGEANPGECIRVNVDGSRAVMEAARAAGVKRVIMISTDKAAHPLNAYGMTKALMEKLVFESGVSVFESGGSDSTEFIACRYGNVIGSTGSVWPAFKRQAAESGYLTLTDPTMTRFFISITDAVDLITYSADVPGGVVVIPRPAAAVMGDVATTVAAHLGLAPDPEFTGKSIRVIGHRAGEKLHEDMLGPTEDTRVISSGNYYLLLGPFAPNGNAISGMHSNDPHRVMTGEEFVKLAVDSEDV